MCERGSHFFHEGMVDSLCQRVFLGRVGLGGSEFDASHLHLLLHCFGEVLACIVCDPESWISVDLRCRMFYCIDYRLRDLGAVVQAAHPYISGIGVYERAKVIGVVRGHWFYLSAYVR